MIYDNGRSHIFGVEGGFVVRHDAAHLQQGNLKTPSYQLMWDTSQASRSQERELQLCNWNVALFPTLYFTSSKCALLLVKLGSWEPLQTPFPFLFRA